MGGSRHHTVQLNVDQRLPLYIGGLVGGSRHHTVQLNVDQRLRLYIGILQ